MRLSVIIVAIVMIICMLEEIGSTELKNDGHRKPIDKKAVAEFALIGLQVLEGAITIYRGEGKCNDAVADLRYLVQEYANIVNELRVLRDAINFLWGKVLENRRFSERLNATSKAMKIMIKEIISINDDVSSDEEINLNSTNPSIPTDNKRPSGKGGIIAKPRLNLAKAKNAMSVLSKAAEESVGGLAIVGVLANFALSTSIHHDQCVALRDDYKQAVESLKKETIRLKDIDKKVKNLKKLSLKVYRYSKEVFIQLDLVGMVEKLNKSLSKSSLSANESSIMEKLQRFLKNYFTYSSVDLDKKFQEILQNWLVTLLKGVKCIKDKNIAEKKAVNACINGNIEIKKYLKNVTKEVTTCNGNNVLKNIETNVEKKLLQLGKSLTCRLNNVGRKNLVCYYHSKGKTNLVISKITKLDINDVKYYVNKCAKVAISQMGKDDICRRKKLGWTVQQISNTFEFWNHDEINITYNDCPLDEIQIKSICNLKSKNESLAKIEKSFNLYKINIINDAYQQCTFVEKISDIDINLICLMKKRLVATEKIIKIYKSKYKVELIQQVLSNCL